MGLSREELYALSVELERRCGADSIPTVESHYLTGETVQNAPTFMCCYSAASTMGAESCLMRRRDPVAMWRHVHFTGHGLTWAGCRTPEQVAQALEAGTLREVQRT
jgi:hypothetical protein